MATDLSPAAVVARDVLQLGNGGRLPTTMRYQERLGVGSGTVQKALRDVRERGGVTLVSRGHQGTFITGADAAALWRLSELPPVHILLPMPGSLEAKAVAHALATQLRRIGAATTIGYAAGAVARLSAVNDGEADLAVVSAGAARDLPRPDTHVSVTLGPGTYYQSGSLVTVRRKADSKPVQRIGIDPDSDDHQRLTRAQFPTEANRFVECNFTMLPRSVLDGTVDAGVWHTVDTLIPLELAGLETAQLNTPQARELANEISPAVVLGRTGTVVGTLLSRIDVAQIRADWETAMRLEPEQQYAHTRIAI